MNINGESTIESLVERDDHMLILWKRINRIIAAAFVIIIIALFPLFYHNYYFDILTAKYRFYYITAIVMTIAAMMVALWFFFIDWRRNQCQMMKRLCSDFSLKSLRVCDWAMLAFILANVISTFQSDYFYESFWGNEGRFMGLFLMLLYGSSYFVISRFFRFRRLYLDLFMTAGVCACLIGILQYFSIDFLGFKTGLRMSDYKVFASTFGNINTYVSYVALMAGVGITLFVLETHQVRKCWYFFVVNVSFIALVTGISDNAYLALAAVFGLLPLYLFCNLRGVKQYILLVTVLFTDIQLVDLGNQVFSERAMGISSLFNFITECGYLPAAVAVLWAVTIGLYVLDARLNKLGRLRKESNIGRWIWMGIIILACLVLGCILYDANIPGNADKYGALSQYLVMNEDWGSSRGYIWKISADMFRRLPLMHKLFGYGPDTFGIFMVMDYWDKVAANGVIFDSAHNEYLQYLITIGIVGLFSYLALLVTSSLQMLRTSVKRPELVAIVFGILSYGAQALVTINVPMVSPIMLTLMMMGVAVSNEANKANVLEDEDSFTKETEERQQEI